MNANRDKLLAEYNNKLVSLFSDFDSGRILKSTENLGSNLLNSNVALKLKAEPIKLPCNIIFKTGQALGIETQLWQLFLDLQIKYFLMKNEVI